MLNKQFFSRIMRLGHILRKNYSIARIDINRIPMFKQIEIETINRCNGKCSFCPVNVNEPQREYAKMSEELFRKIISDLVRIDYKGELCMSSNNEPFLDGRIPAFIKYAKESLPKASLYLWSNGTIVSPDTIIDILPYLSNIYIDNYSDDMHLIENVKRIISKLEESEHSDDIWIVDDITKLDSGNRNKSEKTAKVIVFNRDINEILSSRGGQAPNKKDDSQKARKISKVKCERPFECMVIRPTGKVSLCCCDALGKYEMGDVRENSLQDIWSNSQEYIRVRRHMQKTGRKGLLLCEECDFGD